MAIELDHIILPVNDLAASLAFYTSVIGLTHEGERPPFSVLRVSPTFCIQVAPWGTQGGEHLAFAMTAAEFDDAFARIKATGIAYGDHFASVGNMQGPGLEAASRGIGEAVYLFDPNAHLIEIRHYEVA